MLQRTDVTYAVASTDTKYLCWLCQTPIDPEKEKDKTHVTLELYKHILPYRTHTRCCYELFGVFCLFSFAAYPNGAPI